MPFVLQVENLSKRYVINHRQGGLNAGLRQMLVNGVRRASTRIFGMRSEASIPEEEQFWALKEVSFKIDEGDRIGIIGRNGAGKSTLLKILSRITEPTSGKVSIKGRVSSLLEVGTGFHPELTGRENVFLNGAILGMNRENIKAKFDEIVDFAEVERFIDTPVKHYSSGMYVRLAFAVAANLDPDILIVDEVLAVGDASFQRKCLGKLEDVSSTSGRTIVFVSHNMKAIHKLCNKGLLLESGALVLMGNVSEAMNAYGQLCSERSILSGEATYPSDDSKKMQLCRCWISSIEADYYQIEFCVEIETRAIVEGAYLALDIFDSYNETIYWTSDVGSRRFIHPKIGTTILSCQLPKSLLNPGTYFAHFAIVSLGRGVVDNNDTVRLSFEITSQSNELLSSYNIVQPGYCGIQSHWDILS